MDWLDEVDSRISIFLLVIFILIASTIVYTNVFDVNIPFILVNLMMICANIIAMILYGSHKIIAFCAGLLSFLFALLLQYLITGRFLIWSERFGVILSVCFIYFIYEEIKLTRKKGKSQNNNIGKL